MIWMNCYEFFKNTCGGWCQGCSDCPIARPFHDDTAPTKVTRRMMLKFVIEDIFGTIRVKWFFWRHRVDIKEIVDEYMEKRNENNR